jgi:hypothetical protein
LDDKARKMRGEKTMKAGLRLIGLILLTLAAAGCASKKWTAPGEYLVRNPGTVIAEGPFPDAGSCNAKLPVSTKDGSIAVCIFLAEPMARGL